MDDLNKFSSFKFDKDRKEYNHRPFTLRYFNRHGINEEKLKIYHQKKQQIKSIVSEIQSQVNNYLD